MKTQSCPTLRRSLFFFLIASLLTNLPIAQAQVLPYRDRNLSIDQRVADLLARMTLEEKAAQLMSLWMEKPNDNSGVPKAQAPLGGEFSADLAKQRMPYGIGQLARQRENRGARRSAEYANQVQRWLLDNTRLSIPAVFHDEILHGLMGEGATVFPVPLALASS
ncbi:MAG: glycoside hydrolase family 3 N-terminal domain-containing protein, partial [bacterium]|nr:glycoside hydrolase family 3 N-terminal domain-containing protein [bacterium]